VPGSERTGVLPAEPIWVVSGGNVDGRDAVVELQGRIYGVFRKK
jgi:hypothetical protein